MRYVNKQLMTAGQIAESIRRLTSSELQDLVADLAKDNMGDKLSFAIDSELQDANIQRHTDC